MASKKPCPRGSLPVKVCDIAICPRKVKNKDEPCPEADKADVCEDPACPVLQEDLENANNDVAALEDILNNLTGLCQQPKCQAYPDDEIPCLPRTCPAKDPFRRNNRDYSYVSPAYARIAKELQELKDLASEGLCRSPTCYNAYMGVFPSSYNRDCGSETCCPTGGKGKGCGGLYCPFKKGFKKPMEDGMCGRNPCPLAETKEPLTSICGRDSCPYLPKNDDYPYTGACEPDCLSNSKQDELSICGGPKCPFARPNTPIGKNTCPYGGVPVCPYGGTTRTHKYTEDKGYVNEASRPYGGSASPYDYLGSLDRTYATDNAQNYALFNYTTPPTIPPCPILNKPKQGDCGKPTCIARGARMPDNFCVAKTCPWMNPLDIPYDEDGVCGGPSAFSCNSPDTEYCGSPICPVDSTGRPKPSAMVGMCGGPKNYSCDQSNVEYCGSPVCPVDKRKDSCKTTTCPNLKKLSFCNDCGGALPDKDVDFSEFENRRMESSPGEEYATELSTKSDNTDVKIEPKQLVPVTKETYNNSINNVNNNKHNSVHKKVTRKKEKDQDILEKVTNCDDISVYSYPGTQLGHKYCNPIRPMIPKNMGWLWNSLPAYGKISRWRGYKPGAVSRQVFEIIQKHRRELGLSDDDGLKKKRSKLKFKMEDLKHCVEVKKRNGDYTITVNPVKDPVKTVPFENPFIDCSPILFKVEKDKTEKEKKTCPCDDNDVEDKVSTDSEFEFMFSPPAAIPDTRKLKNKVYKTCDTQYDPKDLPSVGGKKGGKKGKKEKKGKKGGKKGKKMKITVRLIDI